LVVLLRTFTSVGVPYDENLPVGPINCSTKNESGISCTVLLLTGDDTAKKAPSPVDGFLHSTSNTVPDANGQGATNDANTGTVVDEEPWIKISANTSPVLPSRDTSLPSRSNLYLYLVTKACSVQFNNVELVSKVEKLKNTTVVDGITESS
jgi:hypothetical protein